MNLLVEAGADLEATTPDRWAPLHLAVAVGRHPQVAAALIQAGANINHRALNEATPLYVAAWQGNVESTRVLLRANADPLLTRLEASGRRFTPLDAAAQNGHAGVARELVQNLGSEAIGDGASVGVTALRLAAQHRHVNVMAVLFSAGVVDTGSALCGAAGFGNVATVSYLLEQKHESDKLCEGRYENSREHLDTSPLVHCISDCRPCSPRIARLLINAGADSVSAAPMKNAAGSMVSHDTPLEIVLYQQLSEKVNGEDASEEKLHALEAIRRLLLQVQI